MMPWHGPRGKAASAIPPMDIRVIRIGQGEKAAAVQFLGTALYTCGNIRQQRD